MYMVHHKFAIFDLSSRGLYTVEPPKVGWTKGCVWKPAAKSTS